MIQEADASVDLLAGHVTPAELADQLGVTVRTLDRWYARGEGPARVKLGKQVLYRRTSVEDWLRSQEVDPRARRRGRR